MINTILLFVISDSEKTKNGRLIMDTEANTGGQLVVADDKDSH